MALKQQLIEKTYYKMFINEHEDIHPIQVLGEVFQEEAQKDLPELSTIRFAQGEVYFHLKDYEAAIFKWENISNELEPWARKNTADAYYELGMLSTAEDLYTMIDTDDATLQAETALKLFTLYIDRGKLDAAVATIKRTINVQPDYPNLTAIARRFFEEQKDWGNAVELAVNEAKRTESFEWFAVLQQYVEKGVTKGFAPNYFSHALTMLYHLNVRKFEQLVVAFWCSYQHDESYFNWLNEMNHLLLQLEIDRSDSWNTLTALHRQEFYHLIGGDYLIKQLHDYVPDLLTNWFRLADKQGSVWAAAAVLSWNELFPASISIAIVEEANEIIDTVQAEINESKECLDLFDSIMDWARAHDMGAQAKVKWIINELSDLDSYHVLLTGLNGSGKSTIINKLIGQELQNYPTSSVVIFKTAEELEINEIKDEGITALDGHSAFYEQMDRRRNASETMIEFKQPNRFLNENQLAIIDTPGLKGDHHDRQEILKNFHIADTILFVVDANNPLHEKEKNSLLQIQELAPDIPVHFLLNKVDNIADPHEVLQIVERTKAAIQDIFPDAQVVPFSAVYADSSQHLQDLQQMLQTIKFERNLADRRLAKLLFYIRVTLATLLQKRVNVENQLVETLHWNEEMHMKLTGAVNQLHDTIAQKSETAAKSFRDISDSLRREMQTEIPKILQSCSKWIKEDSDFSRIHLQLNDEMNQRLQEYLEQRVMPRYFQLLQGWIEDCKEEFTQCQEFLNELGDGFNTMFAEERLTLGCDFLVLDDWRRDTERMTSGFQLEKVNILLRRTPSQMLLKGAGKLFGVLSQNKAMLYNKFKTFVENEDYSDVVAAVSRQFFQSFELFAKSIERDVSMFFKGPLTSMNRCIEETNTEIATAQELLKQLNTNPEMFRDPLTLFEVRLRQFEWMTIAGKGMQVVS
ncbi:dynamin family protein [Bacillus rubiinfantis]|uniref:dynamin family protein n=1 Tax=Bacillus rubiinfantis TaxID=1499680 RepID=UPI0005A7002A|nr:dynamin family protein [Bacillus rubiinfantis]